MEDIIKIICSYKVADIPILFLILYLLAFLISLSIFLRVFRSLSRRITKLRWLVAIPAIIMCLVNIGLVILHFMHKLPTEDYFLKLYKWGPFVGMAVVYFIYKRSLSKERKLEAEVLAENTVDLMDIRGRNDDIKAKCFVEINSNEKKEEPEIL